MADRLVMRQHARQEGHQLDSQDATSSWSFGLWGILASAVIGAAAGYLLTTPRGRRLCDATIQLLDNFSFECARFCQASTRAQIAAADAWKALEDNLGVSRPPRTTH